MNLEGVSEVERRFATYVDGLVQVIGRADRAGPLRDYCVGLVMPCERKSVEPMAAVTAPDRVAAQHQSFRSQINVVFHGLTRALCRGTVLGPAHPRLWWPACWSTL